MVPSTFVLTGSELVGSPDGVVSLFSPLGSDPGSFTAGSDPNGSDFGSDPTLCAADALTAEVVLCFKASA